MAIQNRRGYEADFDPAKMLPGEWAVSLDTKYVRMCFAPGVCLRMATYEGFEQDMEEVRRILAECRDIRTAVELIRDNVAEAELVIEDYVAQAKQYRDEAEQFKNEAFSTTPEGYADLVQNVAENTVKIDTIIEKAELNIKNTATGENIHLTDSADAKDVAFGLYGKAEQTQYSGKNLAKLEQGSLDSSNGKEVYSATRVRTGYIPVTPGKTYAVSAQDNTLYVANGFKYDENKNFIGYGLYCNPGDTKKIPEGVYYWRLVFRNKDTSEITPEDYWLQVEEGSTFTPYEPYVGGIPSPNPDYPQEIDIEGAGGSVEVKTCGKNLLKNTAKTKTINGVTFTMNDDGSVTANGTHTLSGGTTGFPIPGTETKNFKANTNYIYSIGEAALGTCMIILNKTNDGELATDSYKVISRIGMNNKSIEFKLTQEEIEEYPYLFAQIGVFYTVTTVSNKTFYPMIRLASDTDATYEPYKETTATITTPDGLAGIPVASGGNYTDANGKQWICDEVVKYADGTGKRIQRINVLTCNGSETWNRSNYIYYLSIQDAKNKTKVPLLCSHFKYGEIITISDIRYDLKTDCRVSGQLRVMYSGISTLDEWKAWLAENNVTFVYILETPIETDLTAEEIAEIEKLHTFYPVTNIYNSADCGMEVTYLADSKNYIDNQLAIQAQAQEEALATMLLLLPEETQAAMIENDTNNLLAESEE